MKRPPCEIKVRYVLPAVRAALVSVLEREFGLSVYQIAKILGVTPAAICNYKSYRRSSRRVYEELLSREEYMTELRKWARKLVDGDVDAGDALCVLCRRIYIDLEKATQ
ncbi:MAG: hypothetical protein RMH84_02320 [Sulfolobales archaeon]|nr:hypothetical protein [Sulfolobales archaeon]MCX8208549.1 hypothetical protein [Sulfolobales archaeon]MDW8010413.1 hypothetical protein [Sulfolobales archaeon]